MKVSYSPSYFCIVCCNLSFFISSFVDLILLFFFLDGSAKGLSILFIFSKNQLFSFINLYYCFFHFFSGISAQIFMISFLLPILGVFVLLFPVVSSCFRCKVSLSIQYFFFLKVGVYCYKYFSFLW